ncbi:helix-turn-helix domain-containing protein [Janthinobacterium agaricidamnosum]|uniref:helix-turn-helix domain-containing protein n=1 Tax=Janthinobacterium agaricidamnosum TaxID=55508 RepID=UPI001184C727
MWASQFDSARVKGDPVTRAALEEASLRPGFEQAWSALEEEYGVLDALLTARQQAGLTQEQLAQKMGTTKSAVSRLEASLRSEKYSPSFATLRKYAQACGKKLVLQLI